MIAALSGRTIACKVRMPRAAAAAASCATRPLPMPCPCQASTTVIAISAVVAFLATVAAAIHVAIVEIPSPSDPSIFAVLPCSSAEETRQLALLFVGKGVP